MSRQLLLLFITCLAPTVGFGQIVITDLSQVVTEDFNSLPVSGSGFNTATWTDNTTLTGWYSSETGIRNGTTQGAGNSSGGALYNFGSNGSGDRALGSIGTGTSGDIGFGLRLQNQSGGAIASITVTYTGEQWRYTVAEEMQLLSFSYRVLNAPITTLPIPEESTGYVALPELNFVSPKIEPSGTGISGNGIGLVGNDQDYRTQVSFTFNVAVANGEEIMLRWFDENDPSFDYALAIDDLSISFSASQSNVPTFAGETSIYEYIGASISKRILEDDHPSSFDLPTESEEGAWRQVVNHLLTGSWSQANTEALAFGYEVVEFNPTGSGQSYYILRHGGDQEDFHRWGTYVFNALPTSSCVHLSVPHPLWDEDTAVQGGYLFQELGLGSIAISGRHRCTSNTSAGCAGSSSPCGAHYPISDDAHHLFGAFQFTTEEIADFNSSYVFPQLHGFAHSGSDPDLIVSNGTDLPSTGADDYAQRLVDYFDDQTAFDAASVHGDPYNAKLTGYSNIQGRFLNNYQDGDICSSTFISNTVTNRFLHIEQRGELRRDKSNFQMMADALAHTYAGLGCTLPLPVKLTGFRAEKGKDGEVRLSWEVALEEEMEYYGVERSGNGEDFEEIGRIAAENQYGSRYIFEDVAPLSGTSYYRLKMVEPAAANFSKTVSLEMAFANARLFPNPVKENLTLVLPDENAGTIVKVMVFGTDGREHEIGLAKRKDSYQVGTSQLNPGVYIIRWITEGGAQGVSKFIKQ